MSISGMKKEFIILGVVIVLLLGFLLFRSANKMHYQVPELKPLAVENFDKIEIIKPGLTITISKTDDKWLIAPNNYPTAGDKIEKITGTVAKLSITELISKFKDYERYDLGAEKAIHVKVYQKDQVVRDFFIGKRAPTYGHTFVRLDGDDNVYYALEAFDSNFNVKIDDLRDKTVMQLDQNEISELEIEKEGEKLLFTRQVKTTPPPAVEPGTKESSEPKAEEPKVETTPPATSQPEEINWVTAEGKKGKKATVDSLLGQFAQLSCQEYIEAKTAEDFKDQTPIFTLRLKGAKEYTLKIFAKEEEKKEGEEKGMGGGMYPAISSENPYPFMLSSYKAEDIMKKPGELLDEPEKTDQKAIKK